MQITVWLRRVAPCQLRVLTVERVSSFFTLKMHILDKIEHYAAVYTSENSNGAVILCNDNVIKTAEEESGELTVNNVRIAQFKSKLYFHILSGLNEVSIIVTPVSANDCGDNFFIISR